MLKRGGYRLGRQGRFGNRVIDFFLDKSIVSISNSRLKERFDTVEVEVVGSGYRNESKEIISKGTIACL